MQFSFLLASFTLPRVLHECIVINQSVKFSSRDIQVRKAPIDVVLVCYCDLSYYDMQREPYLTLNGRFIPHY